MRPHAPADGADAGDAVDVVRHEDVLTPGLAEREAGRVRIRKEVDVVPTEQVVDVGVEHAEAEAAPPEPDDDGQVITLPDGSVSVPVFEEQLVITKRMVVRERVIIRKHTVFEEQRVEADLRRERVEVDVDEGVATRVVEDVGPTARAPRV